MNVPNISWRTTLITHNLNSIQSVSKEDIESLTNNVTNEILNKIWCIDYRITKIEHQNNVICRFFKKLCDLKYQNEKIHDLFQKLIAPLEDSNDKITPFLSAFNTNETVQSQVKNLLQHALKTGNDTIASNILLHTEIQPEDFIYTAMEGNAPKSLQLLLKNTSYPQYYYKKILDDYSSQKYANTKILNILLSYYTDPIDLNVLMMKAYESSNEELVKWFLSNGASPNTLIENKKNAFHLATNFFSNSYFNKTFIPLLVKFNGNINLLDANGKTAFEYSLMRNYNNFDCTQLFIDQGADITINSPIISFLKKNNPNKIIPFFSDFPQIVAAFNQANFSYNSFKESLKNNLSEYLKSEVSNANPLIIALLLEDDELTNKILNITTQKEIQIHLKNLAIIYPGTDLKNFSKVCAQ